jgi:hypothetical protein
MAKVIRLADHRAKPAFVHFNRIELALLLNLYARRVASGAWRDYAIDQGPERAVFAVYRHTLERPLLTIAKLSQDKAGYVASSGDRILARSGSLAEVLAAVESSSPRIVD